MVSAGVSSMTAIALVLVCAACGSVGSPQDQYKARGSGHQLHPAASVLAQATDQKPADHLIAPQHMMKNLHEGSLKRERHRRAALERRRRSRRNSPWSGQVRDFSRYQPQPVQISRPYYIPVMYTASRIPMYFPPQPVRTNVGYPPDNKPGPQNAYLPPYPSDFPPRMPEDTNLTNKLDNDNYPVWDYVDAPPNVPEQDTNSIWTTARPSNMRPTRPTSSVNRVPGDSATGGGGARPTTPRPARPTRPTSSVNRIPGDGSIPLSNSDVAARPGQRPADAQRPQRPADTQRPQRPAATQRPQVWQPSTTAAPSPPGRVDSSCVWAILSCCVPGNNEVKESCFANRGCSGPFWGNNPCDPMYTEDVIKVAMNYFE